jgi:hypothetical protein
MTLLTSLARALAAERGRAEPIRTVRHVHLSARPLVFIPLQLAGEANAPLAALIGDDPARPRMLTVYEPRDRTQRFAWAADLAAVVLAHVDEYARPAIGEDDTYPDAPQLLVPNEAGVSFTRLLGRSTRFRRTTGEYAVPESVPVLGRWLSFFAERSEAPASALLLSMTDALTAHWATGQSAVEDANLAALLGWIDPPRGMTGAAAARAAEDPVLWPPAGPATHPDFDNEILDRCLEAVRAAAADGAGDEAALDRARAAMAAALRTQLAPTWSLMWRGIELLRALPEADYLAKGWESDRWYFTSYVRWLADGGAPQARRDSAVSAARRLNSLERSQQEIEVKSAFDDPLLMAEQRMSGEAFAGVVVQAQPDRVDDSRKRRVLRPWVTVETTDDVLVEPGASLKSADRPSQRAVVVDVTRTGERTMVTLELSGGMGNSLTARPGTVPGLGEVLCYTTRSGDFRPAAKWPDAAETPWTHGGPPPEYVPNDDDAGEAWS